MVNMQPGSAFWIGERPDLTVLMHGMGSGQYVAQEDGVILNLHKSVLRDYEYFKQLFNTQPDVSEWSSWLIQKIYPMSSAKHRYFWG